jgi:cyclopropane fatty-acyl-phospholipid synthase-like methyltransferase
VLDVGCGRGMILNRLARLYPRSRFTGIDLSADAIAYARERSSRRDLKNLEFIAQDLSDFDVAPSPKATT